MDGLKKPWLTFKETLQKWFWLDREFLIQACAVSGNEYLSFQRYVALFQLILWENDRESKDAICLIDGTVFPAKTCSATTMSNLVPNEHHHYFWAHVIFWPVGLQQGSCTDGDTVPPLALGHYQQQKEELEEKLNTRRQELKVSG